MGIESEAKNLLNGRVLVKFSKKEFGFKNPLKSRNRTKTIHDNSNKYIKWVKNVLDSYKKKEQPNATAIKMNSKNDEYLHHHLDAFIWLSFSPTIDNSLKDDEYLVEVGEI